MISVVLAVHNGAKFIAEAIESILAQTYGDFEFIVVDDGSTDATAEIVRSITDQRIRYIRNERNLYLAPSLDRGVALARGDWIARMDADDIALPTRLERQLAFLAQHPACGALGTESQIIDGDGCASQPAETFGVTAEPVLLRWQLSFRCPLCHPTVIVRRELILAAGGYTGELLRGRERYSAEDYDLWRRLSLRTELRNLPEPLLRYRRHGNNLSGTNPEHRVNCTRVMEQAAWDLAGCREPGASLYDIEYGRPDEPARRAEAARCLLNLLENFLLRNQLSTSQEAFILADCEKRLLDLVGFKRYYSLLWRVMNAGELAPRQTALRMAARIGFQAAPRRVWARARRSALGGGRN